MRHLLIICSLVCSLGLSAAEVIPPVPAHYFNDYAGVTSAQVANSLNSQLEDFERQTSSQIVVAIYPHMQSDSSIEDYAVRVYRAWKVGTKEKNNGAVLFVFAQDHKMRIQTGYGLEGALPDVICKRILDDEIAPHLKRGDFNGGMTAGVAAMLAAAKGDYLGTGSTVNDRERGNGQKGTKNVMGLIIGSVILIFWIMSLLSQRRGRSRSGWFIGGGGWGGGGGGGWGGGGGGGFSGGGGSSGGGGASGGW